MANAPKKLSNNTYKKGKLSKNARFSPKRIKWTPIIIIGCLVVTFIFAMILGNILGNKVDKNQNGEFDKDSASDIVVPSVEKVNPKDKLHAYFADMTSADPKESLSNQTASARDRGNALFIDFKNSNNEIIYSSDKVLELEFMHQDNLTLSRLNNHFQYYSDFAIGYFESDFSASLSAEKSLKLQTNEILLLKEATETGFDQIIIEFSGNVTRDDLIYYQAYLLNLKLACDKTPIGIVLPKSFLTNSDNAGSVGGLLKIADFFVLDLMDSTADEIKSTLEPLVYFTERYDCVIMLNDADETALEEKISALEDKGIENYIVK